MNYKKADFVSHPKLLLKHIRKGPKIFRLKELFSIRETITISKEMENRQITALRGAQKDSLFANALPNVRVGSLPEYGSFWKLFQWAYASPCQSFFQSGSYLKIFGPGILNLLHCPIFYTS